MGTVEWIIVAVIAVSIAVLVLLIMRPLRTALRESRFSQARKDFHFQRERLEACFFQLASESGKPRGLRWVDCDFDDDVAYALDRQSGVLTALVGMTIRFEAIEGGEMEDVEAVSNLRAATSVFIFKRGVWTTQARTIFNLNPTEAIRFYQKKLVLVGQETARNNI